MHRRSYFRGIAAIARVDTVEIITVLHECADGWHTFTSPEVPGFYMIVEESDLQGAYEDIPLTYDEYLATLPLSQAAITRHYSVELQAA